MVTLTELYLMKDIEISESDKGLSGFRESKKGKMAISYVAFGGNVATSCGNSHETMKQAIKMIRDRGVRITSVSRFFETPAFPAGSGPNFVNGVLAIDDDRSAEALLAFLHEIEAEFGRKRTSRWGARTLDLDVLAIEDCVMPNLHSWTQWRDLPIEKQMQDTPDFMILPHPRLQDRAFVLVPFADVAADWVHPVSGLTVAQMCAALPKNLLAEVKPL